MKKINLIEAIIGFLASDLAGDQKGQYHPEEIKTWMNSAFNKIIYNAWKNGKKYNEFSQLDAWSKTYVCAVTSQAGTKVHVLLPFAPIQLPENAGIRQVSDTASPQNVLVPIEATAAVVFAELEVNEMDSTPTYSLEQNYMSTGAGEPSHLLRLDKLPIAPTALITSVDVLLVQNLDQIDDYDDLSIPENGEDDLMRMVLDIMSKKPKADTSNDMYNDKTT
jgi:hypothetical protein